MKEIGKTILIVIGGLLAVLTILAFLTPNTQWASPREQERSLCRQNQLDLNRALADFNLRHPGTPILRYEGEAMQRLLIEKDLQITWPVRCKRVIKKLAPHFRGIDFILIKFEKIDIPDSYLGSPAVGTAPPTVYCREHGPLEGYNSRR